MKATRKLVATLALWSVCSAGAYALDGAALYQEKICNTCHGETGAEPILTVYPKVSGQNPQYLLQQMKDIRDGVRTNGLSVAMKAVIGTVTDEELQAIADWLSTN